jgi:hypothetical protein
LKKQTAIHAALLLSLPVQVSFVDLAGSERVKDSKSSGETLKETTTINRSVWYPSW